MSTYEIVPQRPEDNPPEPGSERVSPWFEPQNPALVEGDPMLELTVDAERFAADITASMWFVTRNASAPRIPQQRQPSPES